MFNRSQILETVKDCVVKDYIKQFFIIDIDMTKEESLKKLIEKYTKMFPKNVILKAYRWKVHKKEDVIND